MIFGGETVLSFRPLLAPLRRLEQRGSDPQSGSRRCLLPQEFRRPEARSIRQPDGALAADDEKHAHQSAVRLEQRDLAEAVILADELNSAKL